MATAVAGISAYLFTMPAVTQVILKWILITSIPLHATFITSDYLQNAYAITSANLLVKMDSTGNKLFTYSQNRYGQLQFVDPTNPLRLLLSYPDYAVVVLLDNTLSEVAAIPLRPLGIGDYRAVCFSPHDNNFWVYDENDFRLKKIDRNGNIVLQSNDLLQQLGRAVHPVYMQETDSYVFMSDTATGILVFDLYGVYLETLPFKSVSKFQARNDVLFFMKGQGLHAFQMKTLTERQYVLPVVAQLKDIRMENNRIYLLEPDTLSIYRY